jgi:hypothetical protein
MTATIITATATQHSDGNQVKATRSLLSRIKAKLAIKPATNTLWDHTEELATIDTSSFNGIL